MNVIIPIAGYGTRLRPFTHEKPKPLLNVGGKTVLGWIFESISTLNVDNYILIVGYKGNEIKEWVNYNYSALPVTWIIQERRKGLGHAIWSAGKEIPPEEDVLIYLGDTIFDVEWERINHSETNLIAVKEVNNPGRFGIIKVKNDRIVGLIEKPVNPPSNLAVVGLYYLKEWGKLYNKLQYLVDNNIKTEGEIQLTDALQLMIEKGGCELEMISVKKWLDCGTRETLIQTNAELIDSIKSDNENFDTIDNLSLLDESVKKINSNVGPYVVAGKNTIIKNSTVKKSIIGDDVEIENSEIQDSIIGDRAKVTGFKGKFHIASDSIITGKGDNCED